MLSILGTLGGVAKGFAGSKLNPQKQVNNIANAITDEANSQAAIENAELAANGMKNSTLTTARKQFVEIYNANKRIVDQIAY